MTDWTTTSTHDLIEAGALEIGDGYRAKNSEFKDHGLPFLRIGNIGSGRLDLENAPLFPEDEIARVGKKVSQANDCVVATKATIGRLAYIKSGTRPVVYSPQVSYWRVLDRARIEPRYLSYWLQSREFTLQAQATKGSTAMADYINLADQRRMKITLPPLATQRAVAAILAAYDELVENNLRRAEILEQMAQAIYREWFEHFRFPGSRLHAADSTSMPPGWEMTTLGTRVELAYGKSLKASARAGGAVPVFGSGGIVGCHDSPLVTGPGIVVGRKGNVGAIHWSQTDFFPIDTTYYVKSDLPFLYLYFNLCTQSFVNSHAAVPGLSREQAYSNPLLIPDEDIMQRFVHIVTPMFNFKHNLLSQNAGLQATRDLLLPKLISGEIDVSERDIDTSWLAA